MVTLYSSHPASIPWKKKRQLAKKSFGDRGLLAEYILECSYTLNDRVFWLEEKGRIVAWCVRSLAEPLWTPAFMIFVAKSKRRQGWGTFLYQYATKWCKQKYQVYGHHADGAAKFYKRLGRLDYA